MTGVEDAEKPAGRDVTEESRSFFSEGSPHPGGRESGLRQEESALRETKFQYETLRAANLALAESLDLDRVLDTLLDHLAQLVPYDGGAVLLLETDSVVVRASRTGPKNAGPASDWTLDVHTDPILRRIMTTRQTVFIPDTHLDPDWSPGLAARHVRSWCGVPLIAGGEVLGLYSLEKTESDFFTPAHIELAESLAPQAAIAIQNARLLGAEQAAHKRAESLRKISAALTASLDLSQVLNDILTNLERVIPYDSACVFLLEEDHLHSVAGRGFARQEEVIGHKYPLETDRLFQRIVTDGRPLILTDASQEPGFMGWGKTECVRGWMGVPLRLHGRYIGILTVDNNQEGAYSELEANLAQAFANQAAVAIENARLFEQVREGRERLQLLSQQILNVQENERRRIALELHDQIGQTLTAVKINLQTAQRKPEASAFEESLEQSISIVERALSQVRNLSLTLRPSMLDDLGLVAALRWYVDREARRSGYEVEFAADEFTERPDPRVETACFRVAQAALTNIMRHAEARRIKVIIRKLENELQMMIEDDGRGFDVSAALERASRGKSLGLLGMRERVQLLGGKLEIETEAGRGTCLRARFPLILTEPLERRQHRRDS